LGSSTARMRKMRKRNREEIRRSHLAHEHDLCVEGCCDEHNPDPNKPPVYQLDGHTSGEVAHSIRKLRDSFGWEPWDARRHLMTLAARVREAMPWDDARAAEDVGQMIVEATWMPEGDHDKLHEIHLKHWQKHWQLI
jgi:hypothetical protein